MKGLTRLLMAACLCCVVGCNSEIPLEEMSDIQLSKTSCDIQISTAQAKAAGKEVNSSESEYIFGSTDMISLYEKVQKDVDPDPGDEQYCVCGTDVCDKGIGCLLQDGAYTCAGFDKDAVEEGECSPILIDQRYLGYFIVTHFLPILKELMIVRELSKQVLYRKSDDASSLYAWSVTRSLIESQNIKNNFFKSKTYRDKLAKLTEMTTLNEMSSAVPSMMIEQITAASTNDEMSDAQKENIKASITAIIEDNETLENNINTLKSAMSAGIMIPDAIRENDIYQNYNIVGSLVVLGAMAECQNGNSGFCPEERYYQAEKNVNEMCQNPNDKDVCTHTLHLKNTLLKNINASIPDEMSVEETCQMIGDFGTCTHTYEFSESVKIPVTYFYHKTEKKVDIWYPFEGLAILDVDSGYISKPDSGPKYTMQVKNIVKPKDTVNPVLYNGNQFVCNFPSQDQDSLKDCQICSLMDEEGNVVVGPEPCGQIFPKDGLVFHLNGANTNTSKTDGVPERLYSGYRQIAARLLKNMGEFDGLTNTDGKLFTDYSILDLANSPQTLIDHDNDQATEKILDPKEDKVAEMIDKFLVEQTHYLLTARTNLDQLLTDPKIQKMASLLFIDPAGANALEKLECAKVKDMNGEETIDGIPYREVCRTTLTPEMVSSDDAIAIMTALKNMFSYSYGDYFSDKPKLYEAHRRFFEQYILTSMSDSELNYLFEMTFTQNNRCVDHKTPTGQVVGINQYCTDRLFQNNIFTIKELSDVVFGKEGNLTNKETSITNAGALVDNIIMDSNFELKKLNASDEGSSDECKTEALYSLKSEQIQKLAEQFGDSLGINADSVKGVDVISSNIYLGDDKGINSMSAKLRINTNDGCEIKDLTLNGTWISHRCPMGASCTNNNECGMCSNSDVPKNYGWFRGQEKMESEFRDETEGKDKEYEWRDYSHAKCVKGMLEAVDKTDETESGESNETETPET